MSSAIKVIKRTEIGTNACKKIRKRGEVPAVIYGSNLNGIPIKLNLKELLPHLKHHEKILKLELDGKEENVIIKEIQYDVLGDDILHIDFYKIDMTHKITVTVPINFIGTPKGVQHGGIWEKYIQELEITCLPTNIPDEIKINVEHLDIDDDIRVKDIKLENIEIEMDPEAVITIVHPHKKEEEEETPEGEEQKEPEVIKKGKEKKEE